MFSCVLFVWSPCSWLPNRFLTAGLVPYSFQERERATWHGKRACTLQTRQGRDSQSASVDVAKQVLDRVGWASLELIGITYTGVLPWILGPADSSANIERAHVWIQIVMDSKATNDWTHYDIIIV